MQDQIAVEELERGRFLCGRLIAAGGEALSKGRVPGAAQHGAKRNDALAHPGPLHTPPSRRSRTSGAPLRYRSRCTASGTRQTLS